jgi:tryptophan-rich sensory protein
MTRKISQLIMFVLIAFLPVIGAVGAPPGEWYKSLVKPSLNPPSWVFGPVWTLLYALMGISMWLVWNKSAGKTRTRAFIIFLCQLIFNGLWSWLFFNKQRPDIAFIDLVALWATILAMIIYFKRIDKKAALIQIPYILWVSFAGYLNLALWQLNK